MSNSSKQREQELQNRLDDLYKTFRRYRLPDGWHSELYGPDFGNAATLRSTAIQDLSRADLGIFLFKSMTTWGSAEDFKHFLPRLLELTIELESPDISLYQIGSFDPQNKSSYWSFECYMVSHKLRYGRWNKWPNKEQLAVKSFFHAFWAAVLTREATTESPALSWLSWIAHAEGDMTQYLEQWDNDLRDESVRFRASTHLALSIADSTTDQTGLPAISAKGCLQHAYENLELQDAQVMDWLLRDSTLQVLEEAFFRWQEEEFASVLSQAHYWLGWIHKDRSNRLTK